MLPGRAPPLHRARRDAPRRADRDFVELLQELRVTRTGVQILFAFLPSPAFTSRFEDLDAVQRVICVSAVLAAAVLAPPSSTAATPSDGRQGREGRQRTVRRRRGARTRWTCRSGFRRV
ncbi:DUF6328 family protein [Streptomyces luteogriseus]|uniref:DUF6328 family protein n=1 Tax=Streptomyces luteogriseus TaxID=68233 RepID=UPI0037FB223F